MTYLLDTNAWFWLFARPAFLSTSVRRELNRQEVVAVSPFSMIEIAQKNASPKGNLRLRTSVEEWFRLCTPPGRVRSLPITPAIAAKAYDLGADFHGDPADRVIAATAIIHGLTLVTADQKLIRFQSVQTLPAR